MLASALVMLALLGGITFYFARRMTQCVQYLFPTFPFIVPLAVFTLLTFALVGGFVRSVVPLSAFVKEALRVVSAYWMGAFVYLLVYLVLADIVVLAGRILHLIPRPLTSAVRFASVAAALALTAATCVYGFCHAADVRRVSYEASLPGLEQETTVALVSDLHLGAVGSEKRLESVVREINAIEPDIVCIAGDLFDNDFAAIRDPERAAELLGQIRAPHGVYACLGNHDAGGTFHQMTAFLEGCGVRLLNEEAVTVDGRLTLAGRLDRSPIGGNGGMQRRQMTEILAGMDEALPVVVMDHNPARADAYGSEADLILCGHTHKGQIFPGSLITGWMYTVDYGHARPDENGPQVIVTSGAGTWGPPMRVGTDCEVAQIRLTVPGDK